MTEKHINKLFDYLWPAMYFAKDHKTNCIKNLKAIDHYFKKYADDHDKLLNSLSSLDGIGLTIASGLIWSYYPTKRAPFDKYTLTYAIKLKIIPTEYISKNYTKYSDNLKKFCDQYLITTKLTKRKYTIEDFVREALVELENHEYYIEPK